MRGNLADFRIESLMQVLVAGKPTGVLSVLHPSGRSFKAYLENGQLVHAVYDTATGLDALAALMKDQHGTFEFRSGERTSQRTIQTAPQWALMQAVQKAEQLPPSLHSEVRIKRKTPTTNLTQPQTINPQPRAGAEQALGRSQPQLELPRSARAAAGSNATPIESLADMLRSPVSALGSGLLNGIQVADRSKSMSISTEYKAAAEQGNPAVDLEVDSVEPTTAALTPRQDSRPAHGAGPQALPYASSMTMTPIAVAISSDPSERRSRLPARMLEGWADAPHRPVGRFELRKLADRRGLILPVSADPNLESTLVIPAELADRLKLTAGSTVWIGPG